MSPDDFLKLLTKNRQKLEDACRRTIPLKVSVTMEQHTQDNFRAGGYVDGGVHPWKSTMRQQYANDADRLYTPLLSRQQNLYKGTHHRYEPYKSVVYNDVPYASIHNEGGSITVTARMKKYFWARYKETGAEMYKFLALKRVGSSIIIPRRQFIGESRELMQKISKLVENELTKILKP